MSNLDSLLAFMKDNGADELRLGSGEQPQMLSRGIRKRLTIAATDETTLRFLLTGILTPEAEARLAAKQEFETEYDAGALGKYRVKLRARRQEAGFDAIVRSDGESQDRAAQAGAGQGGGVEAPAAPVAARTHLEPGVRQAAETPPAQPAAPSPSAVEIAPSDALLVLLRKAVSRRASDIHLAQGEAPRVRIDGSLYAFGDDAATDLEQLLQLPGAACERLARGVSVEFSVSDPGGGSARVHVYSTVSGMAVAIRLLPPQAPSLESLRLPMALDDLVALPHGLVLVSGASGSGKSTTIAALAQAALQKRSIVLITLEDPIEYVLVPGPNSLVRRREVGRDVPTFAEGLRDALRENPDLLLVGELRDADTIQMAVTAAETGHLVLATLHSRSAPSAITRVIDAYPSVQQEQARRQISESLRAVVAQRLLPKASATGRVPALEVLRVNQAASSLIREGKTAQLATVMQAAKSDGMLLLERCLADQVKNGTITLETARTAANDLGSLALQLGGAPTRPSAR